MLYIVSPNSTGIAVLASRRPRITPGDPFPRWLEQKAEAKRLARTHRADRAVPILLFRRRSTAETALPPLA